MKTRIASHKKELLEKIAEEIKYCKECKRGKTGLAVPGEGSPNAKVMLIGEAPGKLEAATGRPFIGRSGRLLRKLLAEAGLKETGVYLTSAVKYLPKRITPQEKDIAHGRTHLFSQMEVIKPKIVVLLGSTAWQAVLGEKLPISKHRGTVIEKNGVKYLMTYHPAAPLYSPRLLPIIKQDFKKLKTLIKR